jgi:hypothetical protein
MNEVQVQIVELQALQGPLKGCRCVSIAMSLNPQFRGDKQLVAGASAPLDPSTNGGLVETGRGWVNQTIAGVNGVNHALLTLAQRYGRRPSCYVYLGRQSG